MKKNGGDKILNGNDVGEKLKKMPNFGTKGKLTKEDLACVFGKNNAKKITNKKEPRKAEGMSTML